MLWNCLSSSVDGKDLVRDKWSNHVGRRYSHSSIPDIQIPPYPNVPVFKEGHLENRVVYDLEVNA